MLTAQGSRHHGPHRLQARPLPPNLPPGRAELVLDAQAKG